METQVVPSLAIEYLPIDRLKPNPDNARTHSRHQLRKIKHSIKRFGFLNAILADQNDMIIAGHGRWLAAKMLDLTDVPVIRIEGLSKEEKRAYVIADNKLAELAGWDRDILAIELQGLLSIDDFDITLTGFEIPEVDLILQDFAQKPDPDDSFESDQDRTAVSGPGDLWQLGKHRILCGNALQEKCFAELMGKKRAAIVIADAPFNVPIDGNVCGKGAIHHREFAMAAGEMSEAEFTSFLSTAFRFLAKYSLDGSVHYFFLDWRHLFELLSASRQIYDELLNLCVWVKDKVRDFIAIINRHHSLQSCAVIRAPIVL